MTTFNFSSDNFQKVTLEIDGQYAGQITVASEGGNNFRIEDVEVEKEYRGKGFYKALIIAAFNLFDIKTLRSENRNYRSNPVYQHWTGNEDLGENENVWISIDGETLSFDID